jgi:hypothetical protein
MAKGMHGSILPGCMCPWTPQETDPESAYQRGYLDGIGRDCPHCKDYKAMYIKVRDELAAEQQLTERQTARIVELQEHIENFDGEDR